MLSAGAAQYWHRPPSRANTARRLSGARRRIGTRTYVVNRTTDGTVTVKWAECMRFPESWTTSALSPSTNTTARRAETTHNGSYVAFRTRAPLMGPTGLPA
jgi:hypothetical protein